MRTITAKMILAALFAVSMVTASPAAFADAEMMAQDDSASIETMSFMPGFLCQGVFRGSFSNGVRADFHLNGRSISIPLNPFVFTGRYNCNQWGNQAQINYRAQAAGIAGVVRGNGQIFVGYDGRIYIEVQQNNGLSFRGVRF